MSIQFDSETFEADVQSLIDNIGKGDINLISEIEAMSHLGESVSHVFDIEKFLGKTSYFVGPQQLTPESDFFLIPSKLKYDGHFYTIDEFGNEEKGVAFNFADSKEALVYEQLSPYPEIEYETITVNTYLVTVAYNVENNYYTYCELSEGNTAAEIGQAFNVVLDVNFTTVSDVNDAVEGCRAIYDLNKSAFIFFYAAFDLETADLLVVNKGVLQ